MDISPIRLDRVEWIPDGLQTELLQRSAEFAAAGFTDSFRHES
jgi:hypothetical protein